MEQGKRVFKAKAEVIHSADTFEWFAEEGKRAYGQVIPNSVPDKRHLTLKHPVGVVAAISPWNFLLPSPSASWRRRWQSANPLSAGRPARLPGH